MPAVPGTGAAIRRTTSRVRDWLDRRLDADARNIAQLFRTSRDTLVQRIKMIYTDYLGQEPSYLKARTTGAGAALENSIDTEVDALVNSIGRRSIEALTRMQHEGHALHLIPTFDVRQLPERSRYVFNELTTSVVGGGTYFDRLEHMSEQMKDGLTGDVRQSLLNGETFEDVRNRVMTRFGVDRLPAPQGPAFGATMRYKNEARRQWNLLMQDIGDEAGGFAVWMATLDDATTLGCLENHGYLIDGELDGEMPPRHINCRCEIAIVPAGVDLTEFRQEAEEFMDDAPEDAEESWAWRPGGVRWNLREAEWDEGKHPRDEHGRFGPSEMVVRDEGQRIAVEDFDRKFGTRPDHFYRGMTKAEYDATVGPGHGVQSRQDWSLPEGGRPEGTSFAKDASDAESYVNYGQTDPRVTGEPTYLVEIRGKDGVNYDRRDGYYKAPDRIPHDRITRVYEMHGERDSIVARKIHHVESAREVGWTDAARAAALASRLAHLTAQSKGVPRKQMPQFSGTPTPGSPSDSLPKNAAGRVDLSEHFVEHLKAQGIGVTEKVVDPAELRATQDTLHATDVGQMADHLAKGGVIAADRGPIMISRDNYVLDGHHRWAAHVINGTSQMPVRQIDLPMNELLDRARAFSKSQGIKIKESRAIRPFTSGKRETDVGQAVLVRQLVPLEVRSLWKEMTQVTFPKAAQREIYAVALAGTRDAAEQSALGLNLDTLDWRTDRSFQDAVTAALTNTEFGDPYLIACIMPWRPEGVFGSPSPEQVETVVRLQTGQVLYAKQEFDTIEYSRAGVVCPAEGGKIWAVRPKEKNVWILPGGHIDDDEKPSAAAVREMYEETGVKIVLQDYLGEIHTPKTTTFVYLGGATAVDEQAELDPTEIQDAEPRWVDDLYIADRIFVKKHLHQVMELKETRRRSGRLRYVHAVTEAEIHRKLQEAIASGSYGFEDEKHPRDERGRFAPKGTFPSAREPAAPPPTIGERARVTLVTEPREAPASAYQWLHDLHDDPRYVEAKEKLASATPTSEKYGAIRDEQGDLIGVNDDDRTAIHDKIINEYYEKAQQFRVPENTPPTLSYIIGNPGSGKTSFVNMYQLDRTSLVIDNDEIKAKLPEYKNQEVHAGSVQEESAYIERRIVERLNDGNYNLTLNGVGKSTGKVMDTVRAYTRNGYNADLYYMHLPEEKAGARVWKRYTDALDRGEPGRFVDPIYAIKEVDMKSEVTYDRVKNSGLLRSWKAYSSDVPRGSQAQLIEEGRRQ